MRQCHWCSSISSCFHVHFVVTSLVFRQWIPCECYCHINSVFTDFHLCWVHESSWERVFWASKRQGMEFREVGHVLHNIPFLAETGSPAPVFSKNCNVSYSLVKSVTERWQTLLTLLWYHFDWTASKMHMTSSTLIQVWDTSCQCALTCWKRKREWWAHWLGPSLESVALRTFFHQSFMQKLLAERQGVA